MNFFNGRDKQPDAEIVKPIIPQAMTGPAMLIKSLLGIDPQEMLAMAANVQMMLNAAVADFMRRSEQISLIAAQTAQEQALQSERVLDLVSRVERLERISERLDGTASKMLDSMERIEQTVWELKSATEPRNASRPKVKR